MNLDRPTLDRLYRYCFSLTGDEAEAYDLLQDGVERLLRARKRRLRDPFPYLVRILRNRFIDEARRRQRWVEAPLVVDAETVAHDERSLERDLVAAQDFERLWADLGPLEREVLHLWAIEGHTAAEIASLTETPRNTILSRIHRLRKKLVARYEDAPTKETAS